MFLAKWPFEMKLCDTVVYIPITVFLRMVAVCLHCRAVKQGVTVTLNGDLDLNVTNIF